MDSAAVQNGPYRSAEVHSRSVAELMVRCALILIRKARPMLLVSRHLGGLLCASLVFAATEGETARISDLIDSGWLCRIGGWIFLSNAPQSAGAAPSTTHLVSDDSALVAAVLRRDRKATAEFLSLHADPVYA